MATLVMNYTVNPFWTMLKAIGRGIVHAQTVTSYSRAAAELARLGYHEEAKKVMLELGKIKERA
jgi:precorrin-6B methylase 2